MPAGSGQVVEDTFNGVVEQPGNPAFCNAGLHWRDLPSNMEPVRERMRACVPELKYGELSGNHSSNIDFPRAETAPQIAGQREQKSSGQPLQSRVYFGHQNLNMKCKGVSGMAVTC